MFSDLWQPGMGTSPDKMGALISTAGSLANPVDSGLQSAPCTVTYSPLASKFRPRQRPSDLWANAECKL